MGNTHMARIGTRTATIAAAAGGLVTAFFALSPTAAAEPAPAAPGAPGGIDLMQQLGNAPAMASQFLQSAASMLAPKPAAATTPAASAPTTPPAGGPAPAPPPASPTHTPPPP
ncbi:MAG: hypothetical protein ACM4D3_18235, partial [Candidatus Sericytochromatia bacterium]